MTLQRILEVTMDAAELARLLHQELPVRFAHRIKMLEALPNWNRKPQISKLRDIYVTSFKELRLADPARPEHFQRQLRNIQERHSSTNLLLSGFKEYADRDKLDEAQINEWLERFFLLRVSTNMLTSHYLQLICPDEEPRPEFAKDINPYQNSINPQCRPDRIARHAASVVDQMCSQKYGCTPEITISSVAGAQPFPFVPKYLFYIISELLKNAVRATVERHFSSAPRPMPPVALLLSGDANTICIRISDQAGGIPSDRLVHIWSYLYSTAEPAIEPIMQHSMRDSVDTPSDMHKFGISSDDGEESTVLLPLGGNGCGLPLSRLYARYLGGNVELQTLPRFGTDVYIYLNRLGNSAEDLVVP